MTVCDAAGPDPAEEAGTSGGGRPRGDPNLAPRCGAKTRAGLVCQVPGMANGRCRIHGGTSTGPRTAEGFSRLAAAHTTRGIYSATNWVRNRYFRVLACRTRVFCAAKLVEAYLPPALAARLATTPPEFMPPVHYSTTLKSEITTKTLGASAQGHARWSEGPNPAGPAIAWSRPGQRRRAEELEAARAERQVLAPWRAAIAGARLAKRAALAARRLARIAKSRQRPYGASVAGRTGAVSRGVEGVTGDARPGATRVGAAEVGADPCRQFSPSRGEGVVVASALRFGVRRRTPGERLLESRNHDKDPLDPRTVRWPWGGLKGRLCRGTPLGGLLPGVTQPGTWQAVLEAANAAEAMKTWRPPQVAPAISAVRCRDEPPGTPQAKTTLQPEGRKENRCHALDGLACGWSLLWPLATPSILISRKTQLRAATERVGMAGTRPGHDGVGLVQ